MKKLAVLLVGFCTIAVMPLAYAQTANGAQARPMVVRTVNFKKCVEGSKLGKQEQSAFEALKKQMESVLAEKEKTLNEIAAKFEDPDYLDSLSADAETEMKRKFRALSQEFTLLQNQYYQSLQQTNFKVVQKLNENVAKAAAEVAKAKQIDLIVNDEATFFTSGAFDVSADIIQVMDQQFDKEANEASKQAPAALPASLKK